MRLNFVNERRTKMNSKDLPEFEDFWNTFMPNLTIPNIVSLDIVSDYEKWMLLSTSQKQQLNKSYKPFELFEKMLSNQKLN